MVSVTGRRGETGPGMDSVHSSADWSSLVIARRRAGRSQVGSAAGSGQSVVCRTPGTITHHTGSARYNLTYTLHLTPGTLYLTSQHPDTNTTQRFTPSLSLADMPEVAASCEVTARGLVRYEGERTTGEGRGQLVRGGDRGHSDTVTGPCSGSECEVRWGRSLWSSQSQHTTSPLSHIGAPSAWAWTGTGRQIIKLLCKSAQQTADSQWWGEMLLEGAPAPPRKVDRWVTASEGFAVRFHKNYTAEVQRCH